MRDIYWTVHPLLGHEAVQIKQKVSMVSKVQFDFPQSIHTGLMIINEDYLFFFAGYSGVPFDGSSGSGWYSEETGRKNSWR